MKKFVGAPGLLILIGATAGRIAHTAQPPDVVTSDSFGSTAMGTDALYYNYGSRNTAAGGLALFNNAFGSYNTAVGSTALYGGLVFMVQTGGSYNTAVGAASMVVNLTGSNNSAFGNGALAACTSCAFNTAFGENALAAVTTDSYDTAAGWSVSAAGYGSYNTAAGAEALGKSFSNFSTATGYRALFVVNSYAVGNTATGATALAADQNGYDNTATGFRALLFNTSGYDDNATGFNALYGNTTGYENTASGDFSLQANTTGYNDTAFGYQASSGNTTGSENTSNGWAALFASTVGGENTAVGSQALYSNTSGIENTAIGKGTLFANSTGSQNVAYGYHAGYNLTSGSNNVDIGNVGVAGESSVIRIGTPAVHTSAHIAGIYGTSVSGNALVVSPTGQLGVVVSSERFKTSITPMPQGSRNLRRLRPVSFHLKSDPQGSVNYGLIAEQVATVYPDLVIRGQNGAIDGVRYDELAPLLLNEIQRQRLQLRAYTGRLRAMRKELASVQQSTSQMQLALRGLQDGSARLADQVIPEPNGAEQAERTRRSFNGNE